MDKCYIKTLWVPRILIFAKKILLQNRQCWRKCHTIVLYQYLYSIHHDQVIFHEVKLETSLITNMFIYLSNSLIIECHQFCNSWFDFLTSFKHTKNGFKISCNNILLTYTCPTCRVNVNLNSQVYATYCMQYGYCKNKKKSSSKV